MGNIYRMICLLGPNVDHANDPFLSIEVRARSCADDPVRDPEAFAGTIRRLCTYLWNRSLDCMRAGNIWVSHAPGRLTWVDRNLKGKTNQCFTNTPIIQSRA